MSTAGRASKPLNSFLSSKRELVPRVLIFQQRQNSFRQVYIISWIKKTRRDAGNFDQSRNAAGNYRRATCHCFQRRQTKAFVERRINKRPAGSIKCAQFFVVEIIGYDDSISRWR